METILKEADFKRVTIDWLLRKGQLEGDAVLINELPVDDFSRRADLVVANGKLQAFEIKSDVDSLVRLQGQIETYLRFFDKVTVVCSERFCSKVLRMLPPQVEVLALVSRNGSADLKYKRRGKAVAVTEPREYLSFVDKRSLSQALKQQRIEVDGKDSHFTLYQKAALLPKKVWRDMTLSYLKNKYSQTYKQFLDRREEETKVSDLVYLSPKSLLESFEMEHSGLDCESIDDWGVAQSNLNHRKAVDISTRMARFGLISNGPVMAIPRTK